MFTGISPSEMNRIVNCPGSVQLCKEFPKQLNNCNQSVNQSALVHWLIEQKIVNGLDFWRFLGKSPINDQIVDREMIGHVSDYYKLIEKIVSEEIDLGDFAGSGGVPDSKISQRYKIETGNFAGFGGAPDFLHYNERTEELTIINLKYGFLPVTPYNNYQLLTYAWLFHKIHDNILIQSVVLGIYQPRIPNKQGIYKVWKLSLEDIISYYVPNIERALRDSQLKTSITRPGDHCHYCDAMLQCNSNLETCLRIVNLGGVQHGANPTNQQLGSQLKLFKFASKTLTQRLKIVEAAVEYKLEKGEPVEGYHLKSYNGNRYWDISDERARLVGIPTTSKLMNPRQAEQSGFPQVLVDKYAKPTRMVRLTEINIDQINERLEND